MVAQLFHMKDAVLLNNSGNHMAFVQNSKWRCTGNLKAKLGDNINSIFVTLECYFQLVQ